MGKKRLKQTLPAVLEHLPNEIFIAIFSYLNGVDSVFAFSNLNHRFQCLLFEYCQCFDFKSISKAKFDFIFRRHDTQQWKSFQLSNDDDTPKQLEYFIDNYFHINLFPQLKSFSVVKIKPKYGYTTLLYLLRSLTNLNLLTIESICGTTMSNFSLPKLKRLVLSSCRNTKWIMDFCQLEIVEYTITNDCSCRSVLTWPLTLKRLKIIFSNDENVTLIQQSLVHLSQLNILEIYQKERGKSRPNGQVWEQLIHSSLPSLKSFKFYFQFEYLQYPINQIEQVISSFSTPFYILENKWFIRCDRSRSSGHHCIAALYSLPFPFDQLTIFTNSFDRSISTVLDNQSNSSNINIFENVKTLIVETRHLKHDENFKTTKVVNLVINVDINSVNWLHVLTKLRYLSLEYDASISSENFCTLLDNTPDLTSLAIGKNTLRTSTDNWRNAPVCNHLSNKIRCLKFHSNDNRSQCVNKNEFHHIVPIFVSKCQHLSLSIQSQIDIVGLILRRMRQLRSLHVHIMENIHPLITMNWLDQQQTKFNDSNCIIVQEEQDYYFWLGKHP